jgi:hypothetical protein
MERSVLLVGQRESAQRLKLFFRHGVALFLFWYGWTHLTTWYMYAEKKNYLIFAFAYLTAVGLSVSDLLKIWGKSITRTRLFIAFFLLLLYFPWSEWLQLKPSTSREDWSMQILIQTVCLYGVCLFLTIFREISKVVTRQIETALSFVSSRAYLLYLPCVIFFGFSVWIAVIFFNRAPLVEDSAAHLFQAKVFRQFQLYAPVPPAAEFFSYRGDMLAMKDGRWFSMYPPGFSLLLAAAMFLHAEWIFSSLLGALTLAIWISYAKRWHTPQIAALFGWLFVLSPFCILMFSTIMVHSPELFIASSVIYLCRKDLETHSPATSPALLLLMVLAVLVRAFSLLVFLAPVLIYISLRHLRRKSKSTPMALLAGVLIGIALLAFYQWKTSGSPFIPGYLIEYPELTTVFGAKPEGLEIISNNVQGMSKWLTGWHAGSFAFILGFFLFTRKLETWDRILLLGSLGLIVFYFFYQIQDLLFGPRMFFLLAPVLLLLVTRFALSADPIEPDRDRAAIILAVVIFSSFAALPERLPSLIRKWTPTHYQSGNLKRAIDRLPDTKALIFLQKSISQEFVNWNDPFLTKGKILCRDFQEKNRKVQELFPFYQPMYFRQNEEFEIGKPASPFIISPEPDYSSPGQISFFNVALAVQASANYPAQDFFDICYKDLLTPADAPGQLTYIGSLHFPESGSYKYAFRVGMLHLIRALLLPALAFKEGGTEWQQYFNIEEFRKEFKLSMESLEKAGEIGKSILNEVRKAGRRIDKDADGNFSDAEVLAFLSQKIKNL